MGLLDSLKRMRRKRMDSLALLVAASALCPAGCSSGDPVEKSTPAAHKNLSSLSTAYIRATDQLGRGPASVTELMPFLHQFGDPASLLRSPNDDQEYVIVWGYDYRSRKPGAPEPVIAYEREGKSGKRYVLQGRLVSEMTEAAFKACKFPAGHRPPW